MENPEKKDAEKALVLLYPHAGAGNAYLQQLRVTLQSEETLRLHDAQSEKDIIQELQATGRGLLIFCIRHKEDLTLVLNAMTTLRPFVKCKALRVIGVNEIDHPQIPQMLLKRGCADVFSSKLTAKALRHKINQALRIVATCAAPNMPMPQASASAAGTTKKAAAPSQAPAKGGLNKLPALTLNSDCWLVRKVRDLRRVQGKWIVDLIGPGPSTGIWEESPGNPGVWEWTPKALADGSVDEKAFVHDEGAWVYIGKKPDFVWDLGRWRFMGERMDLSFRKGAEVLACRFRLVAGTMEYAENSAQARQKLPVIIKSIENEVRFRNEAKAKAAAKTRFKDEKKNGITFDKEFEEEETVEGNIINWEKDAADEGPELQLELEKPPEGRELQIELERPSEGRELKLRLEKQDNAEGSDGLAMAEAAEIIPFNQAPKPKLKIWIAPLQPREGEKYRPLEATPIELSDQTLLLEIPGGQFKAGDEVVIVMDDGLMKPESRSRAKARLDKVEEAGATDTVTLQVDPNVMHMLDPINKAFELRQEEITNFLKAAKGW